MMGYLATQDKPGLGVNLVQMAVMGQRERQDNQDMLDTMASLVYLDCPGERGRKETPWKLVFSCSASGEIRAHQESMEYLGLSEILVGLETPGYLVQRAHQGLQDPVDQRVL